MDPIALVIGFANTLDVDAGTDALADAATFKDWLAEDWVLSAAYEEQDRPGVVAVREAMGGTAIDAESLATLRALREALRDLLAAHTDQCHDPDAAARLDAIAADAPLRVSFSLEPGRPVVTRAAEGMPRVVGTLLAAMVAADDLGEWQRLKLCGADDCRWAYVDRSRNRSRRWCAMDASCGNRAKVRAYRARQATTA